MNLLDLIIIYLACGSPFGVYYFLNKKHSENYVLLKSFLLTFFWIPYAFRLLQIKVTNKLIKSGHFDLNKESRLIKMQTLFENFLPMNSKNISLFELRETIERYAGLTCAIKEKDESPAAYEKEIYKMNGNKNIEISAVCLNRRNRKKLKSHQTQAREDFLGLLKILFETSFDKKGLGRHSIEFVTLLDDKTALQEIAKLIGNASQSIEGSHVLQLEKDLWTPQEQKQKKIKQIPLTLQTLTAITNSRKKD